MKTLKKLFCSLLLICFTKTGIFAMQNININNLPDDILLMIFGKYLDKRFKNIKKPSFYNTENLKLTCKRWKKLTDKLAPKINKILISGNIIKLASYFFKMPEEDKEKINSIDCDGNTALHYAAKANNEDIVKLLVEELKLNVNAINTNGSTPLHFAASNNNPNILEILLQNGADVNAVNKFGFTPLHFAIVCKKNFRFFKIILLLQYGANVNAVNNRKDTPLLCSIKYNCKPEIINLLLTYRATVSGEDIEICKNQEVKKILENKLKELNLKN